MTNKEVRERYFNWMFEHVWPSENLLEGVYRGMYRKEFSWLYDSFNDDTVDVLRYICRVMDNISYRWDPRIRLDEDRATDGYNLRDIYLSKRGLPQMYRQKYMDAKPVSVFEVLVALSLRCDKDIMGDPDYPWETAPLWFWSMVKNMHILFGNVGFSSDYEVIRRSTEYRIDQFLDRKYSYYGDQGPFQVDHPRKDLRKTDIWMQMNWYLMEHFGSNSVVKW